MPWAGVVWLVANLIFNPLPPGEARSCGDPEKIRPLHPPYQGTFEDIHSAVGDYTTILIWQKPESPYEVFVTGWDLGDTLVLAQPCFCQLAERWPAYVRWERANPCKENV